MCVPVPVRIVEDWVDELSTTPSPSLGWQSCRSAFCGVFRTVVLFVVEEILGPSSRARKGVHNKIHDIITSHNAGEPQTQLGIRVHGQDHLISNLATLPPFDTIRNQIKTIVK